MYLVKYLLDGHRLAFFPVLFPTALGADFRRGVQEHLQLGLGEDDGADIPAFHHDAAARAGALLFCDENGAHARNRGKPRCGLRHLRRADCLRHFAPIEKYAVLHSRGSLLGRWRAQLDVRIPRQRDKTRLVVHRHLPLERLQRQRAVHRATVEIHIPQNFGNTPRDAALPRAGRAVNGDGEFLHFVAQPLLAVRPDFFRQSNTARAAVPVRLRNP